MFGAEALVRLAPRAPSRRSMPQHSAAQAEPAPPAPPEWVALTEQRLGRPARLAAAHDQPDVDTSMRLRAAAAAAAVGPPTSTAATAAGAAAPATASAAATVAAGTAELLQRVRLDLALKSAAYSPEKHVTMVLGRPVQALMGIFRVTVAHVS